MTRQAKVIADAVVRFVGDSGDGMQLTGTEMSRATALAGNDIATFPDYPAEIRAPAGTPAGVSGFQLRFASHEIFSPGDAPDTLVAMNPAALKVHLRDVQRDGIVIAPDGLHFHGVVADLRRSRQAVANGCGQRRSP